MRGVEPAIGGKLAKRFLFEILLPVGVAVRGGGDVARLPGAVWARAVVKGVPAPTSRASSAYLLFKARIRVFIPVVRPGTVLARSAVAVRAASRTRARSIHGIKGCERGAASADVAILNGTIGSSVAIGVGPTILFAVAPRHLLAVAVGPRTFLGAVRAVAAVRIGFAVVTIRQATSAIAVGARRVAFLRDQISQFFSRVRLNVLLGARNFCVRRRRARGEHRQRDERNRRSRRRLRFSHRLRSARILGRASSSANAVDNYDRQQLKLRQRIIMAGEHPNRGWGRSQDSSFLSTHSVAAESREREEEKRLSVTTRV